MEACKGQESVQDLLQLPPTPINNVILQILLTGAAKTRRLLKPLPVDAVSRVPPCTAALLVTPAGTKLGIPVLESAPTVDVGQLQA